MPHQYHADRTTARVEAGFYSPTLAAAASPEQDGPASIAFGLAANTEYNFRISATNSSGTSKSGT